jgi:hypothetical protein
MKSGIHTERKTHLRIFISTKLWITMHVCEGERGGVNPISHSFFLKNPVIQHFVAG